MVIFFIFIIKILTIQKEWAEAKQELNEERENVRRFTLDRDQTIKSSLRQVEDMNKELANALRAAASAESRAAVAEVWVFVYSLLYTLLKTSQVVEINFKFYAQAKLSSLQRKLGSTNDKVCFFDLFC